MFRVLVKHPSVKKNRNLANPAQMKGYWQGKDLRESAKPLNKSASRSIAVGEGAPQLVTSKARSCKPSLLRPAITGARTNIWAD